MSNRPPYKIAVAYDFSEQAEVALAEALDAAGRRDRVVLHVVAVLDDHHGLNRMVGQKVHFEDAEKVRDELTDLVKDRVGRQEPEGLVFFVHARIGNPANEILTLASEADADIIYLGTQGRTGLGRMVLGSVAEKVVRGAHCAVQVVRPKSYEEVSAPLMEPVCDKCAALRRETNGVQWWCEEHSQPYVEPHRYSYRSGVAPMRPDDMPIY